MLKTKHTYNDGIFHRLFHDKEKLLELYNALSGENCSKDTEVQIVTLDNAIFGDRKNDLAFIINNRFIVLIEHQATINPNMPLRMLNYIMKEYEQLYFSKAIYSKQLVRVPTPELYVFYNGKEDAPLEQELKFSDSFFEKCDKLYIEAVVKVINVNYDKGAEILKRCQTLAEYSQFIYMVRKRWDEIKDLETAIKEAIETCIRQGILRKFLKENGGDVVSFLYEALTREECDKIREEDGYQRGIETGLIAGESKIVAMVRRKAEKGCEAAAIADALGLDSQYVKTVLNLLSEEGAKTDLQAAEILVRQR